MGGYMPEYFWSPVRKGLELPLVFWNHTGGHLWSYSCAINKAKLPPHITDHISPSAEFTGQYESWANRRVSDLGIVFPLKHLLSVVGQLDNYCSVWFWPNARWNSSQQLLRENGDNAVFLKRWQGIWGATTGCHFRAEPLSIFCSFWTSCKYVFNTDRKWVNQL